MEARRLAVTAMAEAITNVTQPRTWVSRSGKVYDIAADGSLRPRDQRAGRKARRKASVSGGR